MAVETGEVVSEVAAMADQVIDAEIRNDILENAVENAVAREEAAIQTAEEIARAAMESSRGQEIETLRREVSSWQERHANLEAQMNSLQSSLQEMTGQLSAIALLQVAQPPTMETGLSSSTLPQSEVAEAITEVQAILPETLQNVAEENPVAQTPAPVRRRLWM